MIQVRNVPDALHEELIRRAGASGQTLTDFIQGILEREMARPRPEEVFERIRRSVPVDLAGSAADLIRQERAERTEPAEPAEPAERAERAGQEELEERAEAAERDGQ